MGSKSSSRSGSKSLVKSVETLLPKGMNLIHVVLLILVGCLLCTMMSSSVSTVEGYTCTLPATDGYNLESASWDGTSTGGVAEDTDTVPTVTGITCGSGYRTGSGGVTAVCPDADGSAVLDGCVSDVVPPTVNAFLGTDGLPADACVPLAGALSGMDTVCGALVTKDTCGADPTSAANCYWRACDDLYSVTGTLDGTYFTSWIDGCLGQGAVGSTEQALDSAPNEDKTWNLGGILPLESADNASLGDNDFLNKMGWVDPDGGATGEADPETIVNGIVTRMRADDSVPTEYKKIIEIEVENCADGWLENSDTKSAYKEKAGGRPIMGYNSSEGLVCRNPFYDSYSVPSRVSRLIFNDDICGGSGNCPCEVPSSCRWADKVADKGMVEKGIDGLWHATGGNQSWCKVPACRQMYSNTWCSPSNLADTVTDFASASYDTIPSIGGSVGKCAQ